MSKSQPLKRHSPVEWGNVYFLEMVTVIGIVGLAVILVKGCQAPDKKVTALEYEKVSAEAAR